MAGEDVERTGNEQTEPDLGKYLLALVDLQEPSEHWVQRRVESVGFVGLDRVRRQMSVDFEIPALTLLLAPPAPVVPLTLLEKGTLLTDFDLFDESSQAVPLCMAGFTSEATSALLLAAARRCEVPNALLEVVRGVGAAARGDGSKALREYLDWSRTHRDQLRGDVDSFEALMNLLATRFLLLAQPSGRLDRRRILKFSYEITGVGKPRRVLPGLSRGRYGLAATPLAVAVSLPVVVGCRGYHLEIEAPEGTRPRDVRFESIQVIDGEPYRMTSPELSGHARITGAVAHIQGALLEPGQAAYWDSAPLGPAGRIRQRIAGLDHYVGSASRFAWRPVDSSRRRLDRRRDPGGPAFTTLLRDLTWAFVELWLAVLAGAFALATFTFSGVGTIRLLDRLFERRRRLPGNESLHVVVRLYPDAQGLPAAGVTTALFAAGVLAAGAWNQGTLFPQPGSDRGLAAVAATVLLAIPAAFAGIAARPVHSVTAKQYLPLRLLLLVVSGVSIVAAASFLLWPPGAPPGWLWWSLAGVSGGIMLVFAGALAVTSARSRQPVDTL